MGQDTAFADVFESYTLQDLTYSCKDSVFDYFSLKPSGDTDDDATFYPINDFLDTPSYTKEESTAVLKSSTGPYHTPLDGIFTPLFSPITDIPTADLCPPGQQFTPTETVQFLDCTSNLGTDPSFFQQVSHLPLPPSLLDENDGFFESRVFPVSQEVLKPATPISFIKKHTNPMTHYTCPGEPFKKRKLLAKSELSPETSLAFDYSHSPAMHPRSDRRRSAHREAEQKRRDTLKQNFDALREEIVGVWLASAEGGNREEMEREVKSMSKVFIVQQSYQHILQLKEEARNKDKKIEKMKMELEALRRKQDGQS